MTFDITICDCARLARDLRFDGLFFRSTLTLSYRPPYDWLRMIAFFRDRAIPGVEWVDRQRYCRTIRLKDCRGVISVYHADKQKGLVLEVCLDNSRGLMHVVGRIRRMFDLDANSRAIHDTLAHDPLLAERIRRFPGIRLPGVWDPFEAVVRAIVGQQISVKAAVTQLGRIVRLVHSQQMVKENSRLPFFFPDAGQLAAADLSTLGMPAKRKQTLLQMAGQVDAGTLPLSMDKDLSEFVRRLTSIPGIGNWTAHYVAMRAFGEPDAFPASDLGIIKALQRGAKRPTVRQVKARAEAWRPWRAYGAIYLWMGEEDI